MSTEDRVVELTAVLDDIFQDVLRFVDSAVYFDNERDTIVFLHVCKMVSSYASCLSLFKSRVVSSVPILLRSLYESMIDMEYVLENESGVEQVTFEWVIEQRKLLQWLLKEEGRAKYPDKIQYVLDSVEEKYVDFKRRGYKKRKQFNKIDFFNRQCETGIVNTYYSCDVHTNMVALLRWYTEEQNGIKEINCFRQVTIRAVYPLADLLCALSVDMMGSIERNYACDKSFVEMARGKVLALRDNFSAEWQMSLS